LLAVGSVGVVALFFNRNLGLSLAVLAVYLGCVDGPLKLTTGNENATLIRDVLLAAIVAGVLVRAIVRHRPLPRLPHVPLLILLLAVVGAQVFNPGTPGLFGGLVGIRQHLEFLPMVFLGAMAADDRRLVRRLGALLLVIVAANAIAACVQLPLTTNQFASWGPGYEKLVLGTGNFEGAGRTYAGENGEERVRPFGLSGDTGGSGVYGYYALPFALAFLATSGGGGRGRLLGAALLAVCAVGLLAAQSRGVVISAVVGAAAFVALRARGRSAIPTVVTAGVAVAILYVVVSIFVSTQGAGSVQRLNTLAPDRAVQTIGQDRGTSLAVTPQMALDYPLGVGLARTGPGAGLAGDPSDLNAENQFNLLIGEVGTVGLLVFVALWLVVLRDSVMLARRADRDDERALWAAATAVLVALTLVWLQASPTTGPPGSTYFFFMAGLAGTSAARLRRRHSVRTLGAAASSDVRQAVS
jgi:hypothetical protein